MQKLRATRARTLPRLLSEEPYGCDPVLQFQDFICQLTRDELTRVICMCRVQPVMPASAEPARTREFEVLESMGMHCMYL